jgi:ribosome biogenesis protein Nip4
LTEDNVNKDADSIRDQFKKYTELLKYEENKLKVSDKAKALVQNYSSLPIKLQELLSTHSSEFSKKLEGLPKLFEEREKAGLSEQPGANSYTFST